MLKSAWADGSDLQRAYDGAGMGETMRERAPANVGTIEKACSAARLREATQRAAPKPGFGARIAAEAEIRKLISCHGKSEALEVPQVW